MNASWKEEAELQAERAAPVPGSAPESPTEAPTGTGQGAGSPALSEPPPEAVIGEGGNRIVVRAADGTYAAAPEVKLEFAVGDKVYLKSPQELVRMARDGVAGQQYRQEVQQFREQVPHLVSQFEAMQQELEAQRALNLEILNDEQAYLTRRDEWSQLNAPEARLARYEQQRQQEYEQTMAQQQQQARQNEVVSYFEQNIKPVQDEILNGYQQVTLEAKLGRISMDTMPLLRNGVIPPERLPEYQAYLAGPFRQWLQQEAARTDRAVAAQQHQANTQLRQQQQSAQKLVQSVGRQLAPTGRAGADTPPPAPKPRNREEAKAMIINRSWQE